MATPADLTPELAKKRRVLRRIKITEIGGVDRPCQEGAKVTILKRADASATPETLQANAIPRLEDRIANLAAGIAALSKQKERDISRPDFDQEVAEFRKRGMSPIEAMSAARRAKQRPSRRIKSCFGGADPEVTMVQDGTLPFY